MLSWCAAGMWWHDLCCISASRHILLPVWRSMTTCCNDSRIITAALTRISCLRYFYIGPKLVRSSSLLSCGPNCSHLVFSPLLQAYLDPFDFTILTETSKPSRFVSKCSIKILTHNFQFGRILDVIVIEYLSSCKMISLYEMCIRDVGAP
jgi:hypothetical protein